MLHIIYLHVSSIFDVSLLTQQQRNPSSRLRKLLHLVQSLREPGW